MKSNAIIRIIIWSLILVLLVGILGTVLLFRTYRIHSEAPAATEVLILDEAPAMPEDLDYLYLEATVTATTVNVRNAPSSFSAAIDMLEEGETIVIGKLDNTEEGEWAWICSPITGWVQTEYLEFEREPVSNAVTGKTAIANDLLPVYSSPNTDSTTMDALDKGTAVTFSLQETINDMKWTYITSPTAGWVPTDLLEEQSAAAPSAAASDLAFDPRQISELDIEWVAGTITIEPAAVEAIQVSESEPSKPKYAMVWKQTNDKLVIRFCEDATLDFNFGITINDVISKDLTILVPIGWELDSLEVDAASAELEVKNLVIQEVDFDGASGLCTFENCVIDKLDVDTDNGDIHFTGSLETLDCDAASASVIAVFDNVPKRIDMDSMSGDLDITLPSNAGFDVSMSALSSAFRSELDYYQKNGNHYRGNGDCKINMDAMSGELYIREYKEAEAAPAVPSATESHHHTNDCTTDPDSCPESTTHHTEAHHE